MHCAPFGESGAVDVESFPALRHATLHWHASDERLRRTVHRNRVKLPAVVKV